MNDIQVKLADIFVNVFSSVTKENFDLSKDRDQYEDWDSLNHMQLISEIESGFSISLELEEIMEINSAKDFVDLIDSKKQ